MREGSPFRLSVSLIEPSEDAIFDLTNKINAVLNGNDQSTAVYALQDCLANIIVQSSISEAAARHDVNGIRRGLLVAVRAYFNRPPAGRAN